MLQISSGKLFQNGVCDKNKLRGIIYSNLFFPDADIIINTAMGSLRPSSKLGSLNILIYELEELIEDNGPKAGSIASYSMSPYILDFSTIISFYLNCIATPNHELIDKLLDDRPRVTSFKSPKNILSQTFSKNILINEKKITSFIKFTEQLLGLKRKTYIEVMQAIRTYITAIHNIADDLELAYTLLVASVESLAQSFDGHLSSWKDYDEKKRKSLDPILFEIDPIQAEKIRDSILKSEHMSLANRFNNFSLNYITPSYYRDEAENQLNTISKYDLPKALSKAYQARSQYIHKLKKLPRLLASSTGESCNIEGCMWLTIQGLSRVTRHVITEFIQQQDIIDKEPYNYSLEPEGVLRLPLAPQYWIGDDNNYKNIGNKKLEGFLSQIADGLLTKSIQVTDLSKLLTKIERSYSTLKQPDKKSYMALYLLYNGLFTNEKRMRNANKYVSLFSPEFLKPSTEALILNLIFEEDYTWDLESHLLCLNEYFETRHHKSNLRLPKILETGIILDLAERYRLDSNFSKVSELISMSAENDPGNKQIRDFETSFEPNKTEINWLKILQPNV